MIYAGYILLFMLGLRFLVVLVNFLSHPFLSGKKISAFEPKVSVLIPCRNEEHNLPQLLSDIEKCGYSNLEVIVCNDHSTDGTEAVLADFKLKYPHLSYFNGAALPEGWIGKNFACHQLAQKGNGEYFLFLDADVRILPGFISKIVSCSLHNKLSLLSIFPQQIIASRGEWCTVPLMNWILLSYLPLPLVRWKRFSSLSAANGQVMLFDAHIYRKQQWHEKVKGLNVEDIAIARMIKKNRLASRVLLGNNDVLCRMYSNYSDAVNGFSRNMHQFFGGSRVWLLFFVLVSWLRIPALALIFSPLVALAALLIVFIMKLLVSILSKQSALRNYQFHFNQLIALTHITYRNLTTTRKGHIEWKGREYNLKKQ